MEPPGGGAGRPPELATPGGLTDAERRGHERRRDGRVADLSLPELRRVVVTAVLGTIVVALFLWMVRAVLVAGLLGAVSAAFLRPLYEALLRRVRQPNVAGLLTLVVVFVPVISAFGYGYSEAIGVVGYVSTHQAEVANRLARALAHIGVSTDDARRWVVTATTLGTELPIAVRAAIVRGAVATTVLVFTVMYMLTDGPRVIAYLRARLSPRYEPLAAALERNVRGVLAGALYGTAFSQLLKSGVILVLGLAFGVPLTVALAAVSFVVGLFPVVGSWTVYVPVAGWLYVFRDAPLAALTVLVVGFVVNTLFISTYLRPKLAARRSRVLNFYWMFVGFVTGVYAFGLPGLALGPALIALLKAVVDTVTESTSWPIDDEQREVAA